MIQFPFVTEQAIFLARPNRYRIDAQLVKSGAVVAAHCPNPGRLGELLIPGATVYLSPATNSERRTAYDLRFVEHPEHGELVSLDTRLPNQLFAAGFRCRFFDPFTMYTELKQEVSLPASAEALIHQYNEDQHNEHQHNEGMPGSKKKQVRSRIDFQLFDQQGNHCWVEVKSVSLVVDGCARFPDAVTDRGRRHVLELAALAAAGERTAIVFIVQRSDAQMLRPQWDTDPAFGDALCVAQAQGVAIHAYTSTLTTTEVHLARAIPICLDRDV